MNRIKAFGRTCVLAGLTLNTPYILAQKPPGSPGAEWAQYESQLQQVLADKAAYATAVVARWESDARASGRWDDHYSNELFNALMSLQPPNLVAAGQARSYKSVLNVIATGSASKGPAGPPLYLGDIGDDLVYTPIAPCRIVDTRLATKYPHILAGGTVYLVDVDGASFTTQGGNSSGCGIPFGVARAVHMTLTVTNTQGGGFFNAWGIDVQPLSSVIDYAPGSTVANTATIPVLPGAGDDFSIYSSAATSVVIDVVGYFAAPQATSLACTTVVNGPNVVTAGGGWFSYFAVCPDVYHLTGGGFDFNVAGIFATGYPDNANNRFVATFITDSISGAGMTYAQCCRVPGR
jgi:hypothetical protein